MGSSGFSVLRVEGLGFSVQGTKGGTLIRDLRGYFGVICGLVRYVGTI